MKQTKTVAGCFSVLFQFYFRICNGLYVNLYPCCHDVCFNRPQCQWFRL